MSDTNKPVDGVPEPGEQGPADLLKPEAVLDFWFGDDPPRYPKRSRLWFVPNDAFDAEIRERFAKDVRRAAAGDYDHWGEQPQSVLALIILLDQFTRNLHRQSAAAFANDPAALNWSKASLARGFAAQLEALPTAFLYMPLMHSESLSDQEHCVELFTQLKAAAEKNQPELVVSLENSCRSAREHRDTIRRFGRFPYRNAALGRENTLEEAAYLEKRHGHA